jgi:hypothetical protein
MHSREPLTCDHCGAPLPNINRPKTSVLFHYRGPPDLRRCVGMYCGQACAHSASKDDEAARYRRSCAMAPLAELFAP